MTKVNHIWAKVSNVGKLDGLSASELAELEYLEDRLYDPAPKGMRKFRIEDDEHEGVS